VTRISVVQSSKIVAALYFLYGGFYTVAGVFMLIFREGEAKVAGIFLLFMPLLSGVMGFVFCALSCWVYNMLAKVVGGFEFELDEVGE
jgi:hypothetical protein